MDTQNENIYAAPQSEEVANLSYGAGIYEKATLWQRFGGNLLDSLVLCIVIIPLAMLLGIFVPAYSEMGQIGSSVVMGLFALLLFFAINYSPLKSKGKTVGKMIVKTHIVHTDGTDLTPKTIFRRYLFMMGVGLIPVIGSFISLIDSCFIFREDRQCLHDKIANTMVVKD